jgi:hypothetical protein
MDCVRTSISIPLKYFEDESFKEFLDWHQPFDEMYEENGVSVNVDTEGSGEFPEIEEHLIKQQIPFDRQSEGYCESPCRIRQYRPETDRFSEYDRTSALTADYEFCLLYTDVKKILDNHALYPIDQIALLEDLCRANGPCPITLESLAEEVLMTMPGLATLTSLVEDSK